MRLYLVHARMWLLVLLTVIGLASVHLAAAPAMQPKRASFEISNAFAIKVPEGAKRVRVWFAVPQGDTESEHGTKAYSLALSECFYRID